MFTWNWKKEILTVPNLLSLLRLALIPVYMRLYLDARTQHDYLLAGSVMAASCLTDALDGQIARRFGMVSHVGKVLDPMADKFTQLALMLCLCASYPLLYPVLALFVVKELFQLTAMLYHIRQGKALPGALPAGKICTGFLFTGLIFLALFPRLPSGLAEGIILADGVFLLVSFISYIQAYFGRTPWIRDLESE